jgi:hypothetical protein
MTKQEGNGKDNPQIPFGDDTRENGKDDCGFPLG